MGKGQQVQGEGNYEASRTYNEATKRFVESGKVDKAAQDALRRRTQKRCNSPPRKRKARAARRKKIRC